MRKLVLLIVFVAAPFLASAQYYWDFGGGAGIANYLGEMGGKELTRRDFVSDMKMQLTRQSATAFARYKLSPMFSVKGSLNYLTIRGNDELSSNAPRHYRNLSFRNNMFELAAECQYFFYEVNDLGHTYRYKDNFRAYIGLGVAGLYHNPKAFIDDPSSGFETGWYALRPLQTENHRYTKITVAIPASAGFYFTINKFYRIGWNLTWRTTFTDYLDDASTVYQDPASLNSDLSRYLNNRTNATEANNFQPGFQNNYGIYYKPDGTYVNNKRGDPTHNDSYLTSNVEFSYVLRGKSSLYRSHYSSLFRGKKYRHRKVRAKF